MKYTIVSIDESRADNKALIRNRLSNHEEILIQTVNGYDPEQLRLARERFPDLEMENSGLNLGELGCWYSQLYAWEWAAHNEPIMVIEDDAVPAENFDTVISPLMKELPADYDYLNLHVPDNQLQDFWYRTLYDINGAPRQMIRAGEIGYRYSVDGLEFIVRTYQGYSTAANLYSCAGGQNLINRLEFRKMAAPVDIFLYQDTHLGNLIGYAHHPEATRPVIVDHNVPMVIRR